MPRKTKAAVETKPGAGVIIEVTAYGMFFMRDAQYRVWDGKKWRGFGMANLYSTFREAFAARHVAVAAL